MLKIKLISTGVLAVAVIAQFAVISPARADVGNLLWGGTQIQNNVQNTTGLGEEDPRVIAAQIIKIALGFLGIIALVIIMVGGFKWMTSSGADDKIGEAKNMIIAGCAGLLVILAAYGIANFVLTAAYDITNANG